MPENRKPWPMKWVALAIVVFIALYTVLTLRFRKPGPAFQPYEDLKNRANVSRLLQAGYQRVTLAALRPADGARTTGGASVMPAPGGLPPALRSTLVEPPLLPVEITTVTAAATAHSAQPYSIQLACTLPDDQHQLGGAELFVHADQLVVAPTFERIGGNLLTRSRQAAVLITIPAGTLKSGHYLVTLVGERGSRTWPLEVK